MQFMLVLLGIVISSIAMKEANVLLYFCGVLCWCFLILLEVIAMFNPLLHKRIFDKRKLPSIFFYVSLILIILVTFMFCDVLFIKS